MKKDLMFFGQYLQFAVIVQPALIIAKRAGHPRFAFSTGSIHKSH